MPRHISRHPQGVLDQDSDGIRSLAGTTVPTDGTAGYSTGCIFYKTDGTSTTFAYQNRGSVTSCDFDIMATRSQEITDSTGGTTRSSIAATVGCSWATFPHVIPAGTSAGEVVTAIVPGFRFKIIYWQFVTTVAGTGAGASRVYNMEIGTTDVGTTPSTCTLLLASTSDIGEVTLGTAVSGAATGGNTDTFSIELASGGTAFTAGAGYFLVNIQNVDVADAFASLLA